MKRLGRYKGKAIISAPSELAIKKNEILVKEDDVTGDVTNIYTVKNGNVVDIMEGKGGGGDIFNIDNMIEGKYYPISICTPPFKHSLFIDLINRTIEERITVQIRLASLLKGAVMVDNISGKWLTTPIQCGSERTVMLDALILYVDYDDITIGGVTYPLTEFVNLLNSLFEVPIVTLDYSQSPELKLINNGFKEGLEYLS